jgi:urease accessory protein
LPPEGSGATEEKALAGAGRKLLSGRLELAFAADTDRRTYLKRQYAGYPFHVCRALYQDKDRPSLATIYLQSCSGGVYEDDRLDMTLAAEERAEAHVSTQSSTIVHTMPSGSASLSVRIDCDSGSYLEYLPDPQILFPRSRCSSKIVVGLRGDAVALISDAFLSHDPDGQHGVFSAYESEIFVEDASGRALAIDRLRVDGRAFRDACPGISGVYTAQGTMIVAGLALPARALAEALRDITLDRQEAAIGSSELPNSAGLVVRMLAADGAALKRAMYSAWCAGRLALKGSPPQARRK